MRGRSIGGQRWIDGLRVVEVVAWRSVGRLLEVLWLVEVGLWEGLRGRSWRAAGEGLGLIGALLRARIRSCLALPLLRGRTVEVRVRHGPGCNRDWTYGIDGRSATWSQRARIGNVEQAILRSVWPWARWAMLITAVLAATAVVMVVARGSIGVRSVAVFPTVASVDLVFVELV